MSWHPLMIRLGKSVQELARETVEEILGYEGEGGHKPARSDIQKIKDVYDLYKTAFPSGISDVHPWQVDKAHDQWMAQYKLTEREQKIVELYQHILRTSDARGNPEKAFEFVVSMLTSGDGGFVGHEQDAKRYLGGVLKKYEQSHYPTLYESIQNMLFHLERREPSSYKLWSWAVKQLKAEFQDRLQNGHLPDVGTHGLRTGHLEDIVSEGGALLNRLRAENRIPQGLDINRMNFSEFEDWLMQWKRDNREAEAQGEVVYQYDDGWTMQKLTTPEQLQFEGDEMGHCLLPSTLVGYTPVADVQDGTVSLGETVYHARSLPYTGQALRISTAGTLPIEVTPEHQFLVVRPRKTTPLQDRYFKNRMPEDLEPQWLRANEIKVGDYLLSPVPDLSPVPLPSDLAWMYGVYIGDGGTNGSSKGGAPLSGIQFTLGPDDDLDRLVETLTNEGYRPKVTDRGTYRRVRVNSRTLAEQFVGWFGSGSENKRMPDWLLGHSAALEGLLSADGHFKESEQSWTFTSTSRVLAQQVWLAARAQGFYPSITTYKRKEGNGYPNAKPSWKVRWQINDRRWAQNRQWRKWYVTPVNAIDSFHYEGDVYSPETVSHTYLVNGVICHNCVGGYAHTVGEGQDIIYSLRDPKGMPHVTMEVKALDAYKDGAKANDYQSVYVHPEDTPGEHKMQGSETPTGEEPFEVVQVQGNSNHRPKPEYQHKVKEFLDALRAKGWKFVRSDDWYPNEEERYGGGDEYEDRVEQARELDDWYDNDYKTNHELYRGVNSEDAYGLPMNRMKIGVGDWDELFKDIFRSLLYEYDPGKWQGNWRDLAQAVYHAWFIDIYKDRLDPEALEKHRKSLVDDIQSAEETLHEWNDENWMYAEEHMQDEIAEEIKKEAEERGELQKIETALDEEYGEDGWDDSELVEWVRDNDEDLYYHGTDKARDEATDSFAGDAYKFVNYVIQLAEKYGGMHPQDLPNPNDRHGGLPSFEELEKMPWKSDEELQQQTPVEKGLPGALSSWNMTAGDWTEALREKAGKGDFAPGKHAIITYVAPGSVFAQPQDEWAPNPVPHLQVGDMVTLVGTVGSGPSQVWDIVTEDGRELQYPRMRMYVPDEPGVTGELWPDTLPWGEAEQNYYRTASEEYQIHPIDQEHNVWFDEDGNQHARWRPGWTKDPATGKMVQTGELEDTFLDRQGRQGQGWVAYHDDNPIGSLTYVADPAGWNMLGTTFVHPDYREQGLFNRMVAPLREEGKPIDAYVWNNPWLKGKVRGWQLESKTAMGQRGDLPVDLELDLRPTTIQTGFGREAQGYVVIARSDGRQIGELVIIQPATGILRVQDIGVNPEYRRMGIATAMLQRAESELGKIEHDWMNMSEEGDNWARSVSDDWQA